MKLLTFFLPFFFQFFLLIEGTSQCCPSGNVSLKTQAEVYAFGLAWPNCTKLSGDLSIGHPNIASDIHDLTVLKSILIVEGLLHITNNPMMNNTSLGNLRINTCKFMIISKNDQLQFLSLNKLLVVESSLEISNNQNLLFIGLNRLRLVGNIKILNNPVLSTLGGLKNLTGSSTTHTIEIVDNPKLIDISSLKNIESINTFIFTNNKSFKELGEFENVSIKPNGVVMIQDNSNLSICNVKNICSFLDDYLGNGGFIIVGNNAPSGNCNLVSQVQTACKNPACGCFKVIVKQNGDIETTPISCN